MAVGSLYALCFALMAGRLPRFQKHPYLWGAAVALVIFFIIEPLFNVLAMVVFGVPIGFFLMAMPFLMTKGIAVFGFHCIDSHCHGIADTHLWGTDGVSGRKEIGLFRLRKVIPCSLITVYPFICRS